MASFRTRMIQTIIWVKIAVLQMTNLLTGYAMSIMITYLTSVWKFNLTDAAAVVNLYAGAVAVIPMGMIVLVDTVIGSYRFIILCGCVYTMGFCLLTMSTPPVLHKATGTCSAYEAKCVGKVQVILFYAALPLIALGASGRFMVDAFRKEQLYKPLLQGTKKLKLFALSFCPKRFRLVSFQIMISSLVLGVTAYIKPWSLRFGLPTIFTLLATITLLTSTISPLKKQRNLFIRDEIISILRVSPICIFLIPIGVVTSLGNTYFTEQASKMNHKVGSLRVSVLFLTIPRSLMRSLFSKSRCCDRIVTPRIGISLSMALAILCCITAALVEKRRLGVVKRHGLVDKADEQVPMTMFWLLPQFLLVGGVNGLSEKSIALFYTDVILHWPKLEKDENGIQEKQEANTRKKDDDEESNIDPRREEQKLKNLYIDFFVDALEGVGNIGSVVIVYVVEEMQPTWFQETVNRSRLDKYYWTLAAFTAVNLVAFVPVIFYLLRFNAAAGAEVVYLDHDEDAKVDAAAEEFVVEAATERAEQVDVVGEDGKAGAADEDGKVTPIYVGGNVDMPERKEELKKGKNQFGYMGEKNKKEQRDMNHIINIGNEVTKEEDKSYKSVK